MTRHPLYRSYQPVLWIRLNRDLRRVFAPIGLAIGAEFPEEIALSIVAELVQQRGLEH